MDYTNFLTLYSKEYETETTQITDWINYLIEIKNQSIILKDSTENETRSYETYGKNLITLIKNYFSETYSYSDEPSQLWNISKLFGSFLENTGKLVTEDILMLNVYVNTYLSNIIIDIEKLINNINKNTCFHMEELSNVKRNYNLIQGKYSKLKSEIEEAHMSKKKLELDPKVIYNISIKEKAETKILGLLKEMQNILPEFENISKEMENKKTAFNKLMKESFELVVGCVFKNHIKLRETFFLISKEKEEIFLKWKQFSYEKFTAIRETNIQLNDFVERKYAELKNIYFDSIDSIIVNEDDLANSLLKISDTLVIYAENFYNLMKKRKRILKEFYKFILLYSKTNENFSSACLKINKQIIVSIQSLKEIGKGTKKSWEIYLQQYCYNSQAYENFSKFLVNTGNFVNKIAKEIKLEYVKFLEKWNKYLKQINSIKPQVIKYQSNKSKIISQIRDLRGSILGTSQQTTDKCDAKTESKLNQMKGEENYIRENISSTCKKFKDIINISMEFIKTTVKPIRDSESNKIHSFVDILENIGTNSEKIFDQNLEYINIHTEMTINIDIYEEVKDIFEKYLEKYNIQEKFFEIIIKKILKNNTFSTNEIIEKKINNYIIKKEKGSLTKFDSGRSDFMRNNLYNKTSSPLSNSPIKNNLNISNNEEFNKNSPIAKRIEFTPNNNHFNIELRENQIFFNENLLNNNVIEQNNHNNNDTINVISNGKKKKTASFENPKNSNKKELILNNNYELNNISPFEENDNNKMNYTFNSYNKENKSDFSNNVINIDEFDKADLESVNMKSPNVNIFKANHNLYDRVNSSSIVETLTSLEDDKMNFINLENFKILENNGYANIKENEIKEYMDKLSNLKVKKESRRPSKPGNKTRFGGHFDLQPDEIVLGKYSCAYSDKILLHGKLYITTKKITFKSWFNNKTLFGTTKLIIPLEDIEKIEKKTQLKIFDNSLEIVTKKLKLFFTSFAQRDHCYRLLLKLVMETKSRLKIESDLKEEKENAEEQNLENNRNNPNSKLRNFSVGNKILKKIDFYKKLDLVHIENLEKFEKSNFFKPLSFYTNIYFDKEPMGNISLPVIYNYIYNQEIICEDFKLNKTFWESLFIMRKDWDITYQLNKNNTPKFYSDLDYLMSTLSNFDEENLNEFLEEIKTWPIDSTKFTYKLMHPVKKKAFGPEKINMTTEYSLYFISPKLLIVEEISSSTGFMYCDYFSPMLQSRFYCDLKFNQSENVMKFQTTMTVGFQMHFYKSCMFKNLIESEGSRESQESIKFTVFENFKLVLDRENSVFNEHFKKLTEENTRRISNNLSNSFNDSINKDEEEQDIEEEKVEEISKKNLTEENKKNDEGIELKNEDFIKILNFKFEKKFFFSVCVNGILGVFILINLTSSITGGTISMDKVLNTVLLAVIVYLFYRTNGTQ